MALSYDEVRAAVLDYIRLFPSQPQRPAEQVPMNLGVFGQLEQQGRTITDEDRETARQVFQELYLERIIVTGDRAGSSALMSWPFYRVTPYGKQVLASTEYQPYDPGRYIKRLREAIPMVHDDILRYLEEALLSFRYGALLASCVMLGCAAEKAALLLIETFGNAIADTTKRAKYEKDIDHWVISTKYKALWKRLEPLAPTLPGQLGDGLHTILDRVFDLIRVTRNDAGHPTGKRVEREVILGNYILFPSYCKRVYGLIEYFTSNPANI